MSTICRLDGSFIKNPSDGVRLFGAQFLRRTFQLFRASPAVREGNLSQQFHGLEQSKLVGRTLHMSRQICGEKSSLI